MRREYSSARWKALREEHLAREPYCRVCDRDGMTVVERLEVDHIKSHRGDPRLFWDPANLQTLCRMHHAEKTRSEERAALGIPGLVLVLGAPGSGKSTFARERMRRGDVRLCVDELVRALTGLELRDKPEEVVAIALAARDGVLRSLRAASRVRRAFVLTSAPSRLERERLVAGCRVEEIVVMPATLEDCLARIAADPSRAGRVAHDQALARDWFARFEAPRGSHQAAQSRTGGVVLQGKIDPPPDRSPVTKTGG